MKSTGKVNPRHTCTHSPCSTPLSSWSAVGCWMSSQNKHNLQKDSKEDRSKENGGRQEKRESAITVRSLECWIWTIIWHGNTLKRKYPPYFWLINYIHRTSSCTHTHTLYTWLSVQVAALCLLCLHPCAACLHLCGCVWETAQALPGMFDFTMDLSVCVVPGTAPGPLEA